MAYDRLKVRIFELKKTQKKVAEELGLKRSIIRAENKRQKDLSQFQKQKS